MANERTYILTSFYMGKAEEIKRGNKALLIWLKSKLSKEIGYRNAKLTIVSEMGLKYSPNYIKK